MPEKFKTTPDTPEKNENLILHRRHISDVTYKNGKANLEYKVENLIEKGIFPMESPKDKVLGIELDTKTHQSSSTKYEENGDTKLLGRERFEMNFKAHMLPEFQSDQWEKKEELVFTDLDDPADILIDIATNNAASMKVDGRVLSDMKAENNNGREGFQSDHTIDRPIVLWLSFVIIKSLQLEDSLKMGNR